jgi:hypothetical protein
MRSGAGQVSECIGLQSDDEIAPENDVGRGGGRLS